MITDGNILDTVLNDFLGAITGNWGPYLQDYLHPLLLALVCLQFGMIAVEATIARDIPIVLMHVMLGIIRVGIVVAIFEHSAEWGGDIVQTFRQVGEDIGLTAATPSSVFDQGGALVTAIFSAKAWGHWFTAPIESLEYLIEALFVLGAWTAASLLYLGALIEASLLVYAGPLIISVTPLTWTFDLLIAWGRTVLSIAFKVALILMTLGVGTALADQWINAVDPKTFLLSVEHGLILLIESIIFAFCIWKVPNRLSGLVPGAAVLGFGEALAGMAGSAAKSAANQGMDLAGKGISAAAGPVAHAADHGAQALGHQAMALMQKVQSKLMS
ncbi:MAG: type IV secretion system protein [Deltaproteobacteria bacterium]|nr:type IV secretion system protein [Deltaproteobacteria bacterium]